ncbi:sulfatase-like hydrolase/transferase, partial [Hallella bergensis]|uniref:sulfatase-like hydrolase/transferase n=1 Tax=Hallella bergensis TaxID=242750 RepID=UPI003990D58F
MNKSKILVGGLILGASTPVSAQIQARKASSERPNIVFILADDMGYGDLHCYGNEHIQTPNIDRLAATGTRFTQCYAGSGISSPSRCALVTGKHTGKARIRDNQCPLGG